MFREVVHMVIDPGYLPSWQPLSCPASGMKRIGCLRLQRQCMEQILQVKTDDMAKLNMIAKVDSPPPPNSMLAVTVCLRLLVRGINIASQH